MEWIYTVRPYGSITFPIADFIEINRLEHVTQVNAS